MRSSIITLEQSILNKACAKTDFTALLNPLNNDGRYIVSINSLFKGKNPSLQVDLILKINEIIKSTRYSSIGGWMDTQTNEYCLDANVHIDSLKVALMLAKEHKQVAIYDQKEKEVLFINNNNK